MRYIKYFESETYQKVSTDEFEDNLYGRWEHTYRDDDALENKQEDFTDSEIRGIKKLIEGLPLKIEFKTPAELGIEYQGSSELKSLILIKYTTRTSSFRLSIVMKILKLQDEWFLLTGPQFKDDCYKCDQISGVEDFINYWIENMLPDTIRKLDEFENTRIEINKALRLTNISKFCDSNKLTESYDMIKHLKDRGVDSDKTRTIIDEMSGDVFFFLYNLSGQMVGYQKYNPNYSKKGQGKLSDPKLTKYYNYVTDEGHGKMIAVWGLETYKTSDKYLFITEGIFDIARAHEAGYPGIAVLCNDPSPQLRFWVRTLPQIKIVIYDNDRAGERLRKLGDYSFSVPSGKDLNDLTPNEAKDFLDNIIKTIET